MAHPAPFPAVFVAVLSFFASCAAQQNCSEVQCKLLPVEDFASEFQLKSSEKGVRMVYLYLMIGINESYQPLELKGDFHSERWTWASSIGELMLSLSYDYDVLSLGLLKNQVRKMSVRLKDEPNGCLLGLNSSCQNKVVGRVLLGNVTASNGKKFRKDVVCVDEVDNRVNLWEHFFEGNVKYRCCEVVKQGLTDSIQCEQRVERSNWFIAFYVVLNIVTVLLAIYSPALLLALPDFIFNLRKEYEKEEEDKKQETEEPWDRFLVAVGWQQTNKRDYESLPGSTTENIPFKDIILRGHKGKKSAHLKTGDEIPVDDGSPFTFSRLFYMCKSGTEVFQGLVMFSFNSKLLILWYCAMPMFVYIESALIRTLTHEFSEEISTESKANLVGDLFFLVNMISQTSNEHVAILSYVIFPFLLIMILKKEDFIDKEKSCRICHAKPPRYIGEEVWNHLKIIPEKTSLVFPIIAKFPIIFWLGFLILSNWMYRFCNADYWGSRLVRGFCSLIVLILTGVAIVVTAALTACVWFLFFSIIIMVLIICTPQATMLIFVFQKLPNGLKLLPFIYIVAWVPFYIVLFVYRPFARLYPLLVLFFPIIYPFFLGFHACRFIVRVFSFTVIGLSFNAEIAAPLLTFILLVTSYMHECLCNLQSLCKDVKQMISQEWQESIKGLHEKIRPQSTNDTIPTEVFWYVCNESKVLPVWVEMLRLFSSIAVIFLCAFFALSAIFFGTYTYQIPTVASTVAVFVGGNIPMLFVREIHKLNLCGWKKIKRKEKIKKSVREFITKNYGYQRKRSATI